MVKCEMLKQHLGLFNKLFELIQMCEIKLILNQITNFHLLIYHEIMIFRFIFQSKKKINPTMSPVTHTHTHTRILTRSHEITHRLKIKSVC